MEVKLDKLMDEVQQSREEVRQSRREAEASKKELEDKFASSISELKREVSVMQEKVSQQLRRIGSSTYQFRRKGNEHQFNFNSRIEDAINMAKWELTKAVKISDRAAKQAIQKAELSLDEGAKALVVRQKHIKIADRSDLSWATVKHYMADPLADGPEDEKDIARSEKEA